MMLQWNVAPEWLWVKGLLWERGGAVLENGLLVEVETCSGI